MRDFVMSNLVRDFVRYFVRLELGFEFELMMLMSFMRFQLEFVLFELSLAQRRSGRSSEDSAKRPADGCADHWRGDARYLAEDRRRAPHKTADAARDPAEELLAGFELALQLVRLMRLM